MARIGTELTQRMILNQWVSFEDDMGILTSVSQLKNIDSMPDFQHVRDVPLLGYVYVDHDAGISLKVEGLYQPVRERDPEIEIRSKFVRESVSLKFRFGIIRMLDLHILDESEWRRQSLPVSPAWLQFYESPELNVVRNHTSLDRCRAEGFFDDVVAIIPAKEGLSAESEDLKGYTPEIVWVRLEGYSAEEEVYTGILLNRPNHETGLNKNDVVTLYPMRLNGEIMLQVGK